MEIFIYIVGYIVCFVVSIFYAVRVSKPKDPIWNDNDTTFAILISITISSLWFVTLPCLLLFALGKYIFKRFDKR